MEFAHRPVLLDEVIEGLAVKPDGIYADGTVGGAGHAAKICSLLGGKGRFIGLDRDADAVAAATERLGRFGKKASVVRGNYADMPAVLHGMGVDAADGILLDLGVSSHQLDSDARGFSYRVDAPLDMRMDDRQPLTARDVVNGYSEAELFRIIRDYGEDRFAKNIARNIVAARREEPILTTSRLVEIVDRSIPMKAKKRGGHPAKRTFQAIRIEVNGELEILKKALDSLIDILRPNGRICVISFHSLEDRIVKQAFKKAENPCVCPPDFPVCVCGNLPKGRMLTKKPVLPGDAEKIENPRSKSAKLRIFVHD